MQKENKFVMINNIEKEKKKENILSTQSYLFYARIHTKKLIMYIFDKSIIV